MERQTLAQRIKQLRILSGLSQEELSERTQLSLRTIQRIENGESQPRGYSLQRLVEVLGTTPADLLIAAAESAERVACVNHGTHPDPGPTGTSDATAISSGTTGILTGATAIHSVTTTIPDPATTIPSATTSDNGYLILLNLSGLAFLFGPGLGVIAPFILWLIKKDKIGGVKETGKRVINFQLTWALVTGLYWSLAVYQAIYHVELVALPRGVMMFYLIILGPRLVNIVYVIVNTIRAARNLRPRYVPSIPFFHPVA